MMNDDNEVGALKAELSKLRTELEVAQAFHRVAVAERDYERAMLRTMPRGRPPEDGKTREVTVEFRCGLEQRDSYDVAAKLAGKTRSEWLRDLADEAAELATRRL